MLQSVLRRFAMPKAVVPIPIGEHQCDLLIPVFNRPDMLRNLLASLARTVNPSLLRHIWIGDDGSDTFTADAMDRLVAESGLPVTVIHREKNLGFGGNCNDLFERSDAQVCIILNTDIQLPSFWMERMLAPFAIDPMIALATPLSTNAVNHTVRLQTGQHWQEADTVLAGMTPRFPDDCTAIGFCMAVNARLLKEKNIPLFDAAFGRGYGEDTDLHYRIVTGGLQSVIVDNIIVHHIGEASFSTLSDYTNVRTNGESAFRGKWAKEHAKRYAVFQRKNALGTVRDKAMLSLLLNSHPKHLDFLFVIPTANMRYGGVWFIFEVVQALVAAGLRVGIYDQQNAYKADAVRYGWAAFDSIQELTTSVSSVVCVVSTAQNTIGAAQELARHYGAAESMFLQCMEVVFRSGKNVETFLQYARIPNVITISDCLTEYIKVIHPSVHVKGLRLGPDPLIFYQRAVLRRPRTIAFAANMIPDKGTTQALELALMLWQRGFHLTMFGWDTQNFPIDPTICDVLHDTSREALARLFSETEFMIDQSHLEGLGLLPMEASFCGCIPIVGSRGAAEYLFQDGENSITINGYKNLKAALDRVSALTEGEKDRLRRNAMAMRTEYNLEIGLKDAVEAFTTLLERSAKY